MSADEFNREIAARVAALKEGLDNIAPALQEVCSGIEKAIAEANEVYERASRDARADR